MKSRFVPQLNFANVIATIALFVALGGAAVAAGLPRNSVGSSQLKRGAVTPAKIKKGAVTSGKLGQKSVTAGKLGPNAVLPGNIGNGAITSAKIGAGAVIASSIKNGVVTTNKLQSKGVSTDKLATGAVTNPILANGSVTPNKLSSEFGPIVATLKSGQTLRGVFDLGGTAALAGELARDAVSYQFPLLATPAVTVLKKGETSANCGGLGNGGFTPLATAGNLCVYVTESANLDATAPLSVDGQNNNRLGFGLIAKANEKEKEFFALGQWAVTAP